jgi:hypothetical protein
MILNFHIKDAPIFRIYPAEVCARAQGDEGFDKGYGG